MNYKFEREINGVKTEYIGESFENIYNDELKECFVQDNNRILPLCLIKDIIIRNDEEEYYDFNKLDKTNMRLGKVIMSEIMLSSDNSAETVKFERIYKDDLEKGFNRRLEILSFEAENEGIKYKYSLSVEY